MTLFKFSRNFSPLLIFGRSIYQGCRALTFALAGLFCFGAAGQVMTKISSDGGWVLGMTSVDDDLFVLLDRRDHQVAVYSITDFRLQRHLNLPEVQPRDIASCAQNQCLYISDPDRCCIQRFDLNYRANAIKRWITSRHISKWLVPGSPHGLTVLTPSCNLLVTCRRPNGKLLELSADSGQCLKEIRLPSVIREPHQVFLG